MNRVRIRSALIAGFCAALVFSAPSYAMDQRALADAMAKDAGISKAQASKALTSFVENLTNALAKGQTVKIKNLGAFSARKRAARTGRNPQTGETITISAKTVAKFKASKRLSDALN